MMKTLTLTSALGLVLIAGHASAQEMTYGAGQINAGQISIDSDDLTALDIAGTVELTYDRFVLGASAKHQAIDQGSDTLSVSNYGAFLGYMATPDLMFGAGVTGIAIDSDDTYSGYEVFGQYDAGRYAAALVYERPLGQDDDLSVTSVFGQAALSPDVTVGAAIERVSEFEETVYYLSADYDAGPINARGYYYGVTEVDLAVFGAGGSYDFAQGFFATADLQMAEGFFGDNLNVVSLGGGYRISDNAVIDASFGKLYGEDDEANMLRIGLTFETGRQQRLDAAMSDAIRADLDAGIGQFAPDTGIGSGLNFY